MACWVPLSMEFSRQEFWSGLPCPPPGDLPDPGIIWMHLLHLLHLQAGSLPLAPPRKPRNPEVILTLLPSNASIPSQSASKTHWSLSIALSPDEATSSVNWIFALAASWNTCFYSFCPPITLDRVARANTEKHKSPSVIWYPKLDTGGLLFPVQWLGLCALSEGGLGLIPGQGTRSHMLQLKIPHATTKMEDPCVPQLRPGTKKKNFF